MMDTFASNFRPEFRKSPEDEEEEEAFPTLGEEDEAKEILKLWEKRKEEFVVAG